MRSLNIKKRGGGAHAPGIRLGAGGPSINPIIPEIIYFQ